MEKSKILRSRLGFRETVPQSWFARVRTRIFVVSCVISFCATSFGQQRYYSTNRTMMRSYLNQMNKMNADQKKASIAEAKELVRKSDAKLKDYAAEISRLKSELESAKDSIKEHEKSLTQNETTIGETRKLRLHLEMKLLDGQSEKSPYRAATKLMRDAEVDSAKQAERVLGRPVKDGNPDKVRAGVKSQEYKTLEQDSEWVATLRRYRSAKEQQTAAIKSLTSKDAGISQVDERIVQLIDERKSLKDELATAKSKKGKLNTSIQQLTEEQEFVTQDRDAAQQFLTQVNGK